MPKSVGNFGEPPRHATREQIPRALVESCILESREDAAKLG